MEEYDMFYLCRLIKDDGVVRGLELVKRDSDLQVIADAYAQTLFRSGDNGDCVLLTEAPTNSHVEVTIKHGGLEFTGRY